MRTPYFANTLINVVLPVQTVPTPGELRQGVVLFPLPRVETSGRLSTPDVVLDTGTWFVHDQRASTLPARCRSQRAAQLLADTWVGNVATESINPDDPQQVTNWCRWFVDANPDCAVFAPLREPVAADAMTMTGPVWPAGTDDEAAAALSSRIATNLATDVAEINQTEASPDQGQAHGDITEAAS